MANYLKALFATSAVAATALNAEIVLGENLSLSGYIDMGATYIDAPSGVDAFEADVYEVELAFNFTTETYSAVAEFSYDGSSVEYETITITYAATDELSFTAGNILSYLGWETYDATGLYQISYAYRGFAPLYPAYAVGVSADYVTDAYSVGVWVGEGDSEKVSVEVAGKYTGVENLTVFAGYANDPGYESYNVWSSYVMGDFTFALEWIHNDYEGGLETTGYLAMINYAMGDLGITFRYSVEDDNSMLEDWKLFTVAPSYAFSDNLLGVLEFSYIIDGGFGIDYAIGAELLYTF